MKIKVKYLADIDRLHSIKEGDWIDLRCAITTEVYKGEYKAIPLGVAMELPEGYEAIVAPRSSLFKKHGLICVNSIGIIDESYCGDGDQWHLLVLGTSDRPAIIEKNERICQFRIIKHQPELEFETVESLGNADRGGIGSTGNKDYADKYGCNEDKAIEVDNFTDNYLINTGFTKGYLRAIDDFSEVISRKFLGYPYEIVKIVKEIAEKMKKGEK